MKNIFISNIKSINTLSKKTMILSCTLSLMFLSNTLTAEIYKWKNNDGAIYYSDVPPNNNKTEVELINVNENTSSGTHIIRKKIITDDSELNKELKSYKKIKQHHADEDISGYIRDLKGKLQDYRKATQKVDDRKKNTDKVIDKQSVNEKYNTKLCTIATDNLEQLGMGRIIVNKNKLVKLSKSEHNKKIHLTQKQIDKYC